MTDPTSDSPAPAVAEGARLSVVLEPDETQGDLGNPLPRYVETYPLPHVCVRDGHVWGATRRTHLVHKHGDRLDSVVSFFYTDAAPFYGLFHHDGDMATFAKMAMTLRLLSARQYRSLRFETRPAGPLVWRSEAPGETEALAASIASGAGHYVVFTEGEGDGALLRSHPLDLAFLFPDSGDVRFFTEHGFLPEAFVDPRAFLEKLRRSVDDLGSMLENPKFSAQSALRVYPAYRRIDRDGASYDPADSLKNKPRPVRDIRVYATP